MDFDRDKDADISELSRFVCNCQRLKNPIACVSSGGTTVPLELNTVRFIDNFSSGERGATSAEVLLSLGYHVIFLHRKGSVYPFTRNIRKQLSNEINGKFLSQFSISGNDILLSQESDRSHIRSDITCHNACVEAGIFISISFETVQEYLSLLERLALLVAPMGSQVMFYLAAAVSDFYISDDRMVMHKIQSSEALELILNQVPKCLGTLISEWAPRSFVVSFKLETDDAILLRKARGAILKYGVHLVTRRDVVNLVERKAGVSCVDNITVNDIDNDNDEAAFQCVCIRRPETDAQIEPVLVLEVAKRHAMFAGHELREHINGSSVQRLLGVHIEQTMSCDWTKRLELNVIRKSLRCMQNPDDSDYIAISQQQKASAILTSTSHI
eukprot:gene2583-5055_t